MLLLSEASTAMKSLEQALDSHGSQMLGRRTAILKSPLEMHEVL